MSSQKFWCWQVKPTTPVISHFCGVWLTWAKTSWYFVIFFCCLNFIVLATLERGCSLFFVSFPRSGAGMLVVYHQSHVGWAKATPCPSLFNILMGTLRFAHPTK
jgi:hypothetical protein